MSRSRSILSRSFAAAKLAACSAVGLAGPAHAHGFGQRYELPLPLSLYLFAAGAAVVLSFVIFALFARHAPAARDARQLDVLTTPVGRLFASPAVIFALKLVTFGVFAVTMAAGLWGDPNPYRNIAPTLVWIAWWVGFVYLSALVGNLWALINPWRVAFDAAAWLVRRLGGRGEPSLGWRYPPAFGVWPACALLLAFAWVELVYPNPAVPSHIACFAIGYSILTLIGMAVFGRDAWLAHGEVFGIVFGQFARLAPTEPHGDQLLLRPYGAGLLDERPVSTSMLALVLLLLATVLYDGLLTTPEWTELENALSWIMPWLGANGPVVVRTAGLMATWLLFLAIYGAVSALMSTAVGGQPAPSEVARAFAVTLIPIALGYHVAHYLAFLLIQGQYIIPLISDPFGYGWNLFGTAGYRVDIALVGARFNWYAAVTAIVLGHVAAVYFAHVKALRVFGARGLALRSQVPLTALMVVYTMTGLSIIAEPIVERRTPAVPSAVRADAIAIPADALLPDPGSGLLRPVGSDKVAAQKLTFRVLGSAFHDETHTTTADLLYAYAFAARWGVRRPGDEAHYDPAVDTATAPLRHTLAGVRVAAADTASRTLRVGDISFVRELFTIDVYLAAAVADPDRYAAMAAPWSTLPWHVIVLMEETVGRGFAAFSQAEALRRGVPWLDLARSPELSRRLAALVETFERDGHRPEALAALVGRDDARKRWSALAAFHKAHGHFLVTNGPYRLKRWSVDGATVEAFRDLTYPLGVGSYDAYAIPRRGYVTNAERDGDTFLLSAEVEIVEKFQRSHRLTRAPLRSLGADVRKRLAPECRYTVVDRNGRVVAAGATNLGDDPRFRIDFAGRLPAGDYTLFAAIALSGNMMNADIRRIPFAVP